MARIKRPLLKTEDIAFIRKALAEVREIRLLREFADRRVEALRLQICKRVANALWNRYRVYHRGVEDAPSFLEWVLSRGYLHETYLHHSYQTRLYWVYRVIQTTKTQQLALFGESQSQWGYWYFDDLEMLINERQPDAPIRVLLRQEMVDHPDVAEKVPTIRFDSEPPSLIAA